MATSKPFLPPRFVIRAAWAIHRAIYRISGGRRGLRLPSDTYGTLRLHTIGRRTGAERIAILGYFEDGPNLFTLAMNGWGEPEPAWWLNLQAHPDATLDLPEGTREVTARAAVGEERARLWAEMARHEPNLDGYAARRSGETAVVVFEPRLPVWSDRRAAPADGHAESGRERLISSEPGRAGLTGAGRRPRRAVP